MKIEAKHHKAAEHFAELIAQKLGEGRAVHPETAVSSAARLAGSLLFRSFHLDTAKMAPGSVVLSNEANEKGPMLINIAAGMLQSFGIVPDKDKMGQFDGKASCSNLSLIQVQEQFLADALEVLLSGGLSLEEGAYSVAMTTGWLVKECAPQIGVEKGFSIAVYGFIEGSKTVPIPLEEQGTEVVKRPWYKVW